MVDLNLFVVVSLLNQPVVWRLTSNRMRLTWSPQQMTPLKGSAHGADLDPDDVLLVHPFRGPLSQTTSAEEAVVSLGIDAPCAHLLGQAVFRAEDQEVSLAEQVNCSCGFATTAPTDQVGQLV